MKSTATWMGVVAFAISMTAFADTVTVHWDAPLFSPLGSDSVNYTRTGGPLTQSASAGRYQGSVNAFSGALSAGDFVHSTSDFWAYCSDLAQSLSGNATIVYTASSASARTLDWLGAVNSVLGGNVYAWLYPSTRGIAAAIQIGIWESIYDASGWDLGAGSFQASGLEANTAVAYAAFKTAVENAATPDLGPAFVMRLTNAQRQDVITGRVPEPGSVALLGIAIAVAGWSLRRTP